MSFFDKLFGRKTAPSPPPPPAAIPESDEDMDMDMNEDEDIMPTGSQTIQGPPEFVRAAEMQRSYWTHNADEQAKLEARGVDELDWRERLRLHHLFCLQRIKVGPDRESATIKCRQTLKRLLASDSPYRPRPAMIWQGQSATAGNGNKPDMQGDFYNPSLTHLGCLEVYRVDGANQPNRLDFVSFDELSAVFFAPPNMIRAAKLFYDDGREEIVYLPMLYGMTWTIGNEYDRDGRMTRFVAYLDGDEAGALGALGIGVGQQDFSVRAHDGGTNLFGLGSVSELSFPLDMRDPRFDAKARARGIDPDEVRKQMGVK